MDLQSETRKKEARRRRESQMTGGGPPPPPLSENEKMQFVSHFIMKQRLLIIKGK